jgi:kynurenine formamidase
VLVRTGNARYWNDAARYLAGPGVAASASYWLAEGRVLAVGGGQHGVGRAGVA